MDRHGEEACDKTSTGRSGLIPHTRDLSPGRHREPCSWGAGHGARRHEGQHQAAGGDTRSKEDSQDLASGRGSGGCLEDPSGPTRAEDGVVTFGIDVEYPKEEISMKDYTWVIDQVKNTSVDRELYEKVMIEYCTDEDSQLGQVAEERPDARNIRITRNDADLSKKSGLDYAIKIADDNPGADLWGALPCTAISALRMAMSDGLDHRIGRSSTASARISRSW